MQLAPSKNESVRRIFRWLALKPGWVLAAAVVLVLGPFVTKPFNIDDPLFIWAARQIQQHPADPYGFNVNWNESDDTAQPMSRITKNPPLACYYLALAARLFGWSEAGLHLAFLLPALAAIWGTHRLAHRFCAHPLLAAGLTLFTPVFLVSATSVMCDTMMLAFWVWAVALWVEGLEREDQRVLAVAAVLVALATVTKYFGLCLLPLLLAYGLIRRRGAGLWMAWLLIPAGVLAAYQWGTRLLYGQGLVSDAVVYAGQIRAWFGFPLVGSGLTALSFVGGCLAAATLLAPLLWRTRILALAVGGVALAMLLAQGSFLTKYKFFEGSPAFLLAQQAFWAAGGIGVLGLAMAEIYRQRGDAGSWLLGLWVLGTFAFAAFVNWSVNGRSILPMAPAVAILLTRRFEKSAAGRGADWRKGAYGLLMLGSAFGLFVAWSDFLYARAVRQTVQDIHARYAQKAGRLYFFGHWGFQYYMQESGATAADYCHSPVDAGDFVAVPLHNPTTLRVPADSALAESDIRAYGPRWLATMNEAVGAGFYSSFLGPLPFAFGHIPPERVIVGRFLTPLSAQQLSPDAASRNPPVPP